MNSPVFDDENSNKNTGKIIPIYPLTYELTQNVIRKIIENGVNLVKNNLDETLPKYIIEKYNLCDINYAVNNIHFPENFETFNKARKRLVFEELLTMQLGLLSMKNKCTSEKVGIEFKKEVKMNEIIKEIPNKTADAIILSITNFFSPCSSW